MAYKINLSNEDLIELESRLLYERDSKIYKRLQCLKLKHKNYKNIQIADILSVTKETITNWIKLFLNEGFEGLCHLNYEGRRVSKLEPYNDIIISLNKEKKFSTVVQLKQILLDEYGLEVSKSWLNEYLKKIRAFI